MLVVCDLVCAGCVVVMAVPGTGIGVLLGLRCALAVVSPVFAGTRMATLSDILGGGDLFVLGRSLLRIVAQSALLVGYGLGGLLLAVAVGVRAAVAGAGVVGVVCCCGLAAARRSPARPAGGDRAGGARKPRQG